MVSIVASNAHWLGKDPAAWPDDQCAHGDIDVLVDGGSIFPAELRPKAKGLSISAAGLYLLRTIFRDHVDDERIADDQRLLPCCGHAPVGFGSEDSFAGFIHGCPNGVDMTVRHVVDDVEVGIAGTTTLVTLAAWRAAVLDFVRQVEAFYARSEPKRPSNKPYKVRDWLGFWSDWDGLKSRAELAASASESR